VLGHHSIFPDQGVWGAWRRGGFCGVDLFFVLSGFLVSGLLFREFQKTGSMQVGRFLTRRAWKIYPAFYALLAAAVFLGASGTQLFSEAMFVQNYTAGYFGHTWSLAVEEHAYILIPLLLLGCSRTGFRELPRIIVAIMVTLLAARCINAARPFDPYTHQFASHLRLDGIFFGVLLSYFWTFYDHSWCDRYRLPLAAVGLALMAPPFIWEIEHTPFLYTAGYTLQTLGSGAILLAVLSLPPTTNSLAKRVGTVGACSFSIYLWHTVVLNLSLNLGQNWTSIAIYFLGSVALGLVMAKVVEAPALMLRDKVSPVRA
jgi:peptidoglycan/LPS O-acetylase OafA/YrhL